MIRGFLITTLATLNTVMAPFSDAPLEWSRTYQLADAESRNARNGTALQKPFVTIKIEAPVGRWFQITLSSSSHGGRTITYILPSDLLDEEFLSRNVPPGASYVVGGIPSTRETESKSQVKIQRLPADGELIPIRLEWLPAKDGQVDNGPMTIWLKATERRSETDLRGLSWQRMQFSDLQDGLERPLDFVGLVGSTPGKEKAGSRF
jgi:hypothetical protein